MPKSFTQLMFQACPVVVVGEKIRGKLVLVSLTFFSYYPFLIFRVTNFSYLIVTSQFRDICKKKDNSTYFAHFRFEKVFYFNLPS